MRVGRIASILILTTVLAAPAPSGDGDARRLMEAGLALQAQGRNSDAVEQLSQAIAAHTLSPADTARAYYDRGLSYDGGGNFAAAVADYSEALRRDPGLAPAYNNRGNVYRRLGRIVEAKRDYSAALQCQGAALEYPYYGLGLIAAAEGNREAARRLYQKALAANPDYALAVQALAALDQLKPSPRATAVDQTNLKTRDKPPAPTQNALAAPVAAVVDPVVKPPANTPPKTETAPGGLARIQLGAYGSEAEARHAWDKVAATAPDALLGLSPFTEAVDLPGKGRLWRLRAAVPDRAAARQVCTALSQRGQACIPVP